MSVDYAAVLLDDGARLLLGRQYGGYPCPPGGAIEDGELPVTAAARELLEETSVVVDAVDLAEVGQIQHWGLTNPVPHWGRWYAATSWRGEPVNVDPAKCEGWLWYAYDELPAGMDSNTAEMVARYLDSIGHVSRQSG